MTQGEKVLDYMKKHGSITTMEAFKNFGITRLSARVFELREKGYMIDSDPVKVKTREGEKVTVARYTLKESPAN